MVRAAEPSVRSGLAEVGCLDRPGGQPRPASAKLGAGMDTARAPTGPTATPGGDPGPLGAPGPGHQGAA
jgi:hypothetical protein